MTGDRRARTIGVFNVPVPGTYAISFRFDEHTSTYTATFLAEAEAPMPEHEITMPLQGEVRLALGAGRWQLSADPMRGLVIERQES